MSEYNIVPGDRGDDWVSLMWLRRARRIEAEEIVRHHKQLERNMKPSWAIQLAYTTAGQAVHVYTDGDSTHYASQPFEPEKVKRVCDAQALVRHHKQLEADKRRSVTTDLDQGWAHKAVYTITRRS